MNSFVFFLLFVPLLGFILLNVNFILAAHNPYKEKKTPFECGYHSFLAQNRTQFTISFFIFALLFLVFDLEIVLVYPYTVSNYFNGAYGIWPVLIFIIILTIGFQFELGNNALTIDTKQYKGLNSKIDFFAVQGKQNNFWFLVSTSLFIFFTWKFPFLSFIKLYDSTLYYKCLQYGISTIISTYMVMSIRVNLKNEKMTLKHKLFIILTGLVSMFIVYFTNSLVFALFISVVLYDLSFTFLHFISIEYIIFKISNFFNVIFFALHQKLCYIKSYVINFFSDKLYYILKLIRYFFKIILYYFKTFNSILKDLKIVKTSNIIYSEKQDDYPKKPKSFILMMEDKSKEGNNKITETKQSESDFIDAFIRGPTPEWWWDGTFDGPDIELMGKKELIFESRHLKMTYDIRVYCENLYTHASDEDKVKILKLVNPLSNKGPIWLKATSFHEDVNYPLMFYHYLTINFPEKAKFIEDKYLNKSESVKWRMLKIDKDMLHKIEQDIDELNKKISKGEGKPTKPLCTPLTECIEHKEARASNKSSNILQKKPDILGELELQKRKRPTSAIPSETSPSPSEATSYEPNKRKKNIAQKKLNNMDDSENKK